jgi:hypothetical protein
MRAPILVFSPLSPLGRGEQEAPPARIYSRTLQQARARIRAVQANGRLTPAVRRDF